VLYFIVNYWICLVTLLTCHQIKLEDFNDDIRIYYI